MSKRNLTAIIFTLLIVFVGNINAQESYKIATIDSKELLEFVPGKKEASQLIEDLNQKYKKELALMQNDYNSKYTDFLANQNNLAESIKLRRMQELYELEQNINKFIRIAQDDIDSQEKQLIEPLRQKLDNTINEIGIEQGYICIYDLANPAIAFISPQAIDANPFVKSKLRKR